MLCTLQGCSREEKCPIAGHCCGKWVGFPAFCTFLSFSIKKVKIRRGERVAQGVIHQGDSCHGSSQELSAGRRVGDATGTIAAATGQRQGPGVARGTALGERAVHTLHLSSPGGGPGPPSPPSRCSLEATAPWQEGLWGRKEIITDRLPGGRVGEGEREGEGIPHGLRTSAKEGEGQGGPWFICTSQGAGRGTGSVIHSVNTSSSPAWGWAPCCPKQGTQGEEESRGGDAQWFAFSSGLKTSPPHVGRETTSMNKLGEGCQERWGGCRGPNSSHLPPIQRPAPIIPPSA